MDSPTLKRLQLKLYAELPNPGGFDVSRVVPVFHAFIREAKLPDELLIDVADYSHVHEGPGVVLIGHASDYYLDLGEGRPGLLYSRKREGPEDPEARLADAFRRTFTAARLLEESPALSLRFETDELLLSALDRLDAPNTDRTLAALRPLLERTLAGVYGAVPFEIGREGTEKEPLAVRIRARGAPDVATLLSRLPS